MFLHQLWCHCRSCNSFRVTTSRAAGTWLQKCWSVPSLMYRFQKCAVWGRSSSLFAQLTLFMPGWSQYASRLTLSLSLYLLHMPVEGRMLNAPLLFQFWFHSTFKSLDFPWQRSHILVAQIIDIGSRWGRGLGRSKTPVTIVVRRKYASPFPSDPLFLDYKIVKNFQYFPLKFDQYVAPNCF